MQNTKMTINGEPPANAWELVKQLDADPTEGVIVSVFPESVEDVALTGEQYAFAPRVKAWGVLGNWGRETRLIDLTTEPGVAVKWWQVREFAAKYGYDLTPENWHGPISEIPDQYFGPQENGECVGIRFYSEGPFFWPAQKPEFEIDVDDRTNHEILSEFATKPEEETDEPS